MGKHLPKGHLAKKYKQKEEQKANDEWHRTRFDSNETWRRQEHIREAGLPSTIQLRLLHGNLWAIVVEPKEGFTHLSNEVGLREAKERGDEYHVSICFKSDINAEWKKRNLEHLLRLYGHPTEHIFQITSFTYGMTAELSPHDTVYQAVKDLHTYGSYYYKDIHISM